MCPASVVTGRGKASWFCRRAGGQTGETRAIKDQKILCPGEINKSKAQSTLGYVPQVRLVNSRLLAAFENAEEEKKGVRGGSPKFHVHELVPMGLGAQTKQRRSFCLSLGSLPPCVWPEI